MPNKKEVFELGKDRGYGIGSSIDIPEIGAVIPQYDLPNFSGEIEDIYDLEEVYFETCWEAESNSRQFSPFEFTAQMLNSFQNENGNYVYPVEQTWGTYKPGKVKLRGYWEPWDVFEDGIQKGFEKYWREYKKTL